jgi:hypothetical protein
MALEEENSRYASINVGIIKVLVEDAQAGTSNEDKDYYNLIDSRSIMSSFSCLEDRLLSSFLYSS